MDGVKGAVNGFRWIIQRKTGILNVVGFLNVRMIMKNNKGRPTMMYKSAAKEISSIATTLKCHVCSKEKRITADDMAGYLRSGWPKCCGEQMELISNSPEVPDDR